MPRGFTPRYQRKTKVWAASLLGGSVSIVGNSTNLLSGQLQVNQSRTILRLRGNWYVAFSATTVALDEALITVGVGIFSTDAVVLGSTAMPDPGSEPDFPWLFYDTVRVFSPFVIDGTGSDDSGVLIHRAVVDSRAMRKMKPGQAVAAVVQYQDANGTPPVSVGFDARLLVTEA